MPNESGENDGLTVAAEPQSLIKENELNKPRFKFVYAPHDTKEEAESTIRALMDCDVIAIEQMGGTKDERIRGQKLAQELANENPESARSKEILAALFEEEGQPGIIKKGQENGYYFCKGLVGTGKTILLIDISEEDEAFNLNGAYYNAKNEYFEALNERQPLTTILPKLRTWIDIQAEFNTAREEVITEQLKQASKDFENETNLTIGVSLGTFHTFVSHQMHREGYPIKREFIEGEAVGWKGIDQRIVGWNDQVARQKRFYPDKPIPDNLLKRVIAADSMHMFSGKPTEELLKLDLVLGSSTSDEQVDRAISRIYSQSPDRPPTLQEKVGTKIDRAKKFLKTRRGQRPPRE